MGKTPPVTKKWNWSVYGYVDEGSLARVAFITKILTAITILKITKKESLIRAGKYFYS